VSSPAEAIKYLALADSSFSSAEGLTQDLAQAKKDLDIALSNSFDTPTAMQVILRLVRDANIYMNVKSATPNLRAVEEVAQWVTKVVGIFGLDAAAQPPYNGLGWASAGVKIDVDPRTAVKPYAAVYSQVKNEVQALGLSEQPLIQDLLDQQKPDVEFAEMEKSSERDVEKLALPYLRATSRLRDELRGVVVSSATLEPATKQAILVLSDRIRDYDLADLGVQLDDQTDKPSLIKFVPAARLIAAREEKAALVAEKARQKEEGKSSLNSGPFVCLRDLQFC
jgi:cysteinyl-tRNA synthetase